MSLTRLLKSLRCPTHLLRYPTIANLAGVDPSDPVSGMPDVDGVDMVGSAAQPLLSLSLTATSSGPTFQVRRWDQTEQSCP